MKPNTIQFAVKEKIGEKPVFTDSYYLSKSAPWYAKIAWRICEKHMTPFSYKVDIFKWTADEKKHVDEAIVTCLNTIHDATQNPRDYVFVCGYEFFDKVLASKGIETKMDMRHGDIRCRFGALEIDVVVTPYIDGYALLNRKDLSV